MAIIDNKEEDQGFGNFLAGFVNNSKGAVAVTCVLMSMFLVCFFMNMFALKISHNLENFVLEPPLDEILNTAESESLKGLKRASTDSDEAKQKKKEPKSFWFWKKKKPLYPEDKEK